MPEYGVYYKLFMKKIPLATRQSQKQPKIRTKCQFLTILDVVSPMVIIRPNYCILNQYYLNSKKQLSKYSWTRKGNTHDARLNYGPAQIILGQSYH